MRSVPERFLRVYQPTTRREKETRSCRLAWPCFDTSHSSAAPTAKPTVGVKIRSTAIFERFRWLLHQDSSLFTVAGYYQSFRICRAALRPGAPMMPPPGWVDEPHI